VRTSILNPRICRACSTKSRSQRDVVTVRDYGRALCSKIVRLKLSLAPSTHLEHSFFSVAHTRQGRPNGNGDESLRILSVGHDERSQGIKSNYPQVHFLALASLKRSRKMGA
jgi:hypothetical protein